MTLVCSPCCTIRYAGIGRGIRIYIDPRFSSSLWEHRKSQHILRPAVQSCNDLKEGSTHMVGELRDVEWCGYDAQQQW